MTDDAAQQLPKWVPWIWAGLVMCFVAKTILLAVSIGPDVFPDERVHLGLVELHASSFLPADDATTASLGPVATRPRLYYIALGLLRRLTPDAVSSRLMCRFASILIATVGLWYAYRLGRRLRLGSEALVLYGVLLTSTLGRTFLAAGSHPDNLAILCAIAAPYHLLARVDDGLPADWIAAGVWLCAGCLASSRFLLLAGVLLIVMAACHGRHPGLLRAAFARHLQGRRPMHLAALGTMLVGLLLNLWLYGGNLMHFGRLQPPAEAVVGQQAALQYGPAARSIIVKEFRARRMDEPTAVALASNISSPVYRESTLQLLHIAARDQANRIPRLPRLHYAVRWAKAMVESMHGILAQRLMLPVGHWLWPYYLFYLIGLGLLIRQVRPDALNGQAVAVIGSAALFTLVLSLWVNYRVYDDLAELYTGTEGRHLFPVLALIYASLAWAWREAVPARFRWAVIALLGGAWTVAEPTFFLLHDSPGWYQ